MGAKYKTFNYNHTYCKKSEKKYGFTFLRKM